MSHKNPAMAFCDFRTVGFVLALIAGLTLGGGASHADAGEVTVYKTPWCGCCAGWVQHMKTNGYSVRVKDMESLDMVKNMLGIPNPLRSCHTATVDGYVVEGHVPAADVKRLLTERPKVIGISTPGMPVGSPGMEGGTPEAYDVVTFDKKGDVKVFAQH